MNFLMTLPFEAQW